ncbi:hypothetical protein PVAP13_1NG152519 [Panicum virgatum]|uniref:Uncharacterized protein n=1 Tax=Panicum virgatum TaxID=38727 RepID=A0A8T0WW31_PANVG|nr:hypothetical protein PVAP13_1NG152519 [Panicum virgatum]
MGMICFRCGDPHRRRDYTWSGECSLCGQNHKDVVCRKNPNGKVRWEEISSSASSGTVQMLATPPTAYLPASLTQQYLMAPPVTSPIAPTFQSGGYWLPHATTPSAPMVPFYSTPTSFSTGATPSLSISGVNATAASDSRNHEDVIIGGAPLDRA